MNNKYIFILLLPLLLLITVPREYFYMFSGEENIKFSELLEEDIEDEKEEEADFEKEIELFLNHNSKLALSSKVENAKFTTYGNYYSKNYAEVHFKILTPPPKTI